jgi:hypothetical protein
MGSQWLSCPYQQQVREIIRSGKLGKIIAIDQSWNYNGPRWHVPKSEDVAAIREEDTDWNRWLLGRARRPFNPRMYFEFRIFKDFSGGITDQWYSHGSGLATSIWIASSPTILSQTAASSRGTMFARIPIRSNALPPSPINRFCTPTALPSATPTAIARLFAVPKELCIRPAERAARSSSSWPSLVADGNRM